MNGKVYSLNVSSVKGIPKSPVPSVQVKENFGIETDVHAGDKIRQVSLLSSESINKQKECIKIKKKEYDLSPGDFAENITTIGVELNKLKLGDKIQIGNRVVLEVSKIGKECHSYCTIYKQVGTCIMPKEGIFTRVLTGGEIKVNDTITVNSIS